MKYRGEETFGHAQEPAIGVLVANLGTPDAPTAPALRRYLKEFLWDPRVIELPRWKWWLVLHLFVLTRRPRQSAKLYRKIWTAEGGPLLLGTERLATLLEQWLRPRLDSPLHVAVGMRYGRPSLGSALDALTARGCRHILLLPLYPQYSATSTASTFDVVAGELTRRRWVPELRTVNGYHDDPAYVAALAASIREVWDRDGEPERLLLSFHGIPLSYFLAGDPYYCQCQKTGRLVAEALGLAEGRYQVTFQSLFGKEVWLQPYTDATVRALGAQGVGSLDVACPGFAVDCLETLEEIDGLNRDIFAASGGGRFRYLPCLNERPDHVAALGELALRNLQGWSVAKAATAARSGERRRRAEAQAARYPLPLTPP
ncbi:MAG TPA: ferrochelatase [Thermoanaerobaculia bacterium]|nr:ferrochelatase [Thermoanaerobaculia bacterium]